MRATSMFMILAATALAAHGCSSDSPEDLAPAPDTRVAPADTEDDEDGDDEDEDVPPPPPLVLPPGPPAYDTHMKLIYERYCGDCHTGDVSGKCDGGTCLASLYGDTQLPAAEKDCQPGTKAECGLKRVERTKDPNYPDETKLIGMDGELVIVPDAEVEIMRTWIKDGMPETLP